MPNWYIRFVTPGCCFNFPVRDFPYLPRVGDKVILVGITRTVSEVEMNVSREEIVIRFKENI